MYGRGFDLLGFLNGKGILSNQDLQTAKAQAGDVGVQMLHQVNTVREATKKVEELTEIVGEMNLVCHTLLRVLVAKGLLTREDFEAAFHEADMEDGVADGKLTKKREKKAGVKCPACEAVNPAGRKTCMYCDAPFEQPPSKAPDLGMPKAKPKRKASADPWPPIADLPNLDR